MATPPITRVSVRLSVLSAIFALPLTAIIVWLIVSSVNSNITFAQFETLGNAYLRPVDRLLDAVPRRYFAALNALDKLPAIDAEVNVAVNALELQQATNGAALQFTPAGLQSRKRDQLQLDQVKKRLQGTFAAPAKAENYDAVVADLRGLMAHAGDTSNLILDPDLDTYYLMDVTLLALPQMQDRLAVILRESLEQQQAPTPEIHNQLLVQLAMLRESDLNRISGDIDTCLSEDPNFYGVHESLHLVLPAQWKKVTAATDRFIDLIEGKTPASAADLLQAGAAARSASEEFWRAGVDQLDELLEIRMNAYRTQRSHSLLWTLLALIVASISAYLVARRLSSQLRSLNQDLELSVGHVMSTSESVRAASGSLTQAASTQASALEETSAASHELASLSESNFDKAQKLTAAAVAARTMGEAGAADLKKLVTALDALKTDSSELGSILKAIDEIAFQTNLLALNAAVEAARAGSAGAGFAVVADEVRALAQRSSAAAKETTERLSRTATKTVESSTLVAGVQNRINIILEQSRAVDSLASSLSSSCSEQSQGVAEVSRALQNIEAQVQVGVTTAQSVDTSAGQLEHEADELHKMVTRLRGFVAPGSTKKAKARKKADLAVAEDATKAF